MRDEASLLQRLGAGLSRPGEKEHAPGGRCRLPLSAALAASRHWRPLAAAACALALLLARAAGLCWSAAPWLLPCRPPFRCTVPRHGAQVHRGRPGLGPTVAIVALALPSDGEQLACTLHSFDRAYNGRRGHPYLIMSEVQWPAAAQAALAAETDAEVRFVAIPPEAWRLPASVSPAAAARAWTGVRYYGNTDSYRRMCRFFSGPFFTLPALDGFTYYWRLDAHVRYLCDVDGPGVDPIAALHAHGGVYAYGITMREQMETVPGLWRATAAYAEAANRSKHLAREFGSGAWGRGCHYWSNLEVGRLDFFRDPRGYQSYFSALDAAGGFGLERWGDAPVHSLGVMLHAARGQVLYLRGIGYQHPPNWRCPLSSSSDTEAGVCRLGGAPSMCAPDEGFPGWVNSLGDGLHHAEGCDPTSMLQ